jgi:hypothetical protein
MFVLFTSSKAHPSSQTKCTNREPGIAHAASLIHKFSRDFTLKRKHDAIMAYTARGDQQPRHYMEICTSVSRSGRFTSAVRATLPLGKRARWDRRGGEETAPAKNRSPSAQKAPSDFTD